MQRCNQKGSSNEDRTPVTDENQNYWDKELIHAVAMKIGKKEKHPEKLRLERINVCLDQGADINVQDYRNGDTVLHLAVGKDFQKIVKLVLQRGARTNIANQKGYTALRLAKLLDREEIVWILEGPVEQREELPGFMSGTYYQGPSMSRGRDVVTLRSSADNYHSSERKENIQESPGFVGSKTYPAGRNVTHGHPNESPLGAEGFLCFCAIM